MHRVFQISNFGKQLHGSDECFEIQLVDGFGQTTDSMFIGRFQQSVEVDGLEVPEIVVRMALELGVGDSAYVDDRGRLTYPGEVTLDPDEPSNVFFVRRLRESEVDESGRQLEIQVVNELGQAIDSATTFGDETSLVLNGNSVRREVIDAAARLEAGDGQFVNAHGLQTEL